MSAHDGTHERASSCPLCLRNQLDDALAAANAWKNECGELRAEVRDLRAECAGRRRQQEKDADSLAVLRRRRDALIAGLERVHEISTAEAKQKIEEVLWRRG